MVVVMVVVAMVMVTTAVMTAVIVAACGRGEWALGYLRTHVCMHVGVYVCIADVYIWLCAPRQVHFGVWIHE